ncbi:MAG: hypothetical protein DIU68_007795 [Chloroflexota bacterium]|nr:MAG: hypothetical protein DIU68_15405 [Chloroflexota bacterium]
MRASVTLNRVIILAVFALMLASASLVTAQEAATAAAENTGEPALQGVSTLMFLLGIAAVGAVGVIWYMQERSKSGDETP